MQPLANHLWQSTLFAAAAAALTLLLRNNPARTRYHLWLAASYKFLIPFSLLVGLGSHFGWRQAHAVPRPALPFAVQEIAQPFVLAPPPAAPPQTTPVSLPELLAAFWLCGSLAVCFSRYLRWRRLARLVRAAVPTVQGPEIQAVRELERLAGIRTPVPLKSSCTSLEPGVFGLFHPVLLLPAGIVGCLDDAQLRAVLAHELAHIRRRDNLAAALHMLVEVVFWFHPLVWWLGARLVEERERACDEEVLRLGSLPQTYAEGILQVARFCLESPLACVSGIAGADLKQRIENILTAHAVKLNAPRKLLLAAAALAALAGPVAVGIWNAPASRAQSPALPVAPLAFEVASIHPSARDNGSSTFNTNRGSLVSRNVSLRNFVRWAYQVKDYQVSAPDWLSSARFDIVAKASYPANDDELMSMLQTLLTERFKLVVHRETQQHSIYAMVVGKHGSKLRPAEPGMEHDSAGRGYFSGQNSSLARLADTLTHVTDRPVLDQTGLPGVFDIELKWSTDPADSPSIFTALEEQLGLKLAARKGPMEIIVVDHAERVPTEN